MNFNHLLLNSVSQENKLLEYGFEKVSDSFLLKKNIDDDFFCTVSLTSSSLTAEVFEKETGEKYALIDVAKANGAFVTEIRTKVKNLLSEITDFCFKTVDLKSQYVDWLENELNVKGDYPWESEKTYAVYRCKNKKWFALVMRIKYRNLGFQSDEPVWVVNLKVPAEEIPKITDRKSIFPAWHMNKKYWITVVLSAVTDFENLKKLTLKSRELVE